LAKLSLAGVAGFDGGLEECPFDGGGVGRAWIEGTRIVFINPELMAGGVLLDSLELAVQLRPARSSIVKLVDWLGGAEIMRRRFEVVRDA
jgi:hypothetical protein